MAALRSFDDLVALLSGAAPPPESRFVAYSLPLSLRQLEVLRPLLEENTTLKGLRFRGCRIDDHGAQILSAALAANSTLETLELQSNEITGLGALYLANALGEKFNHTLRSLVLDGNPCLADDVTMSTIASFLARNNAKEITEVDKSVDLTLPSSVQIEQRLLQVEHDLEAHTDQMMALHAMGHEMREWKEQLHMASGQIQQVLEMLKGEVDELKAHMIASERLPHAGANAAGLTAVSMAMASKYEELQSALARLEEGRGPAAGAGKGGAAGAEARVLVDAVEALSKRVEQMEQQGQAVGEAGRSGLEDLRQQAARLAAQLTELQGQQRSLAAGAATSAQLSSVQQQLGQALALAPQVEFAAQEVETLQRVVMALSEEVSTAAQEGSATSTNVAALAGSCAELQQQVQEAVSGVARLDAVVKRLSAEGAAVAEAAAAAAAGITALERGQADLQQEVGNLGLAVGTLEQALEGLDVSDRLAQHEAQLRELRSSSDELRASLGEQLCSQDERLLGLAQQLAGAEAAALKAQAAGEKLREAVRQQLEQWREEAAALMAPLAARLEGLEAQATAGLGELRAEVQAALEAQPGRWAADTERAIQPLQHEICSLEQALQAAAEAAAGASVALCALCKDVAQHPAQWAAAIEAVSVELQQQLAEVKSRQVADAQAASDEAAALQAGVDGSLAAVVALQAQLETQPGCWETEISGAVAPLQWQLGEMDREQQATKQGLADLGEQVAAAEAAIALLREAAASSELRARWQADIEEAETALRDELSELEQQQQARAREDLEQLEEALDALNWRLKHAEASISAVGAHPMQWADDIEDAISSLKSLLSAAKSGAEKAAEAVDDLEGELSIRTRQLSDQADSMDGRLDELHAALSLLQSSVAQQPSLWQAAIEKALEPVHAEALCQEDEQQAIFQRLKGAEEQLVAVQQQQADSKQAVEELEWALAGVGSKAEGAEAALSELAGRVEQQPAFWAEAVATAAEPLQAQAAALQERQAIVEAAVAGLQAARAEDGQGSSAALDAVHRDLKGAVAKSAALEAAVDALQCNVARHPEQWAAAVEGAAAPLREAVTALQDQQSETTQALKATSCTVGGLQEQQLLLAQQAASLEARLAEAASGRELLQLQGEVDAQREALAQQVERIAAGLAAVPPPYDDTSLTGRVGAAEGVLAQLQGSLAAAEERLAEVQAAVGAVPEGAAVGAVVGVLSSTQPLSEQLGSALAQIAELQQQVGGLQAGMATVPLPYDDSPLAARLAVAEGALATLEASLAEVQSSIGAAGAGAPELPLAAQLAGARRDIAALQQSVGELQAAAAEATGAAEAPEAGMEAGPEALGALQAAVTRLDAGQSELYAMLEDIGQEQLDLAARVEMLPALVLGQHAEREGATPSPAPSAVPALSLSSLQLGTPNSAAAQALESHPLLTARTWYEDSSEDMDAEAAQINELTELRVSLAAQTKQCIRLEAVVTDQAAKIDRLETQLRMFVGLLSSPGSVPAATPFSTGRRSFQHFAGSRSGATPLSAATLRSAYFDARSEAGEEEAAPAEQEQEAPPATMDVPLLSLPPHLLQRAATGGKQPALWNSGSCGDSASSHASRGLQGLGLLAREPGFSTSLDGRLQLEAGGVCAAQVASQTAEPAKGEAGSVSAQQQGRCGLSDATNRSRSGRVAAAVEKFGGRRAGEDLDGPAPLSGGQRGAAPAMKPAAH